MFSTWIQRMSASLVAGIAVASVSYVATMFVLLVGSGFSVAFISTATWVGYNAVFAFVLAGLVFLFGFDQKGWVSAIAGIVVGFLSVLLGMSFLYVSLGITLDQAAMQQLFQSFLGINAPFWITSAIALPTIGRSVYAIIQKMTAPLSGKIAFVAPPSAHQEESSDAEHIERRNAQWDAYTEFFSTHGWSVVGLTLPSGVARLSAVGEVAFLCEHGAILSRREAKPEHNEVHDDEQEQNEASTAPEVEHMDDVQSQKSLQDLAQLLRGQGLISHMIEHPGRLDSADIVQNGSILYVGVTSRTNSDAIQQLRAIAQPWGYSVIAVEVCDDVPLSCVLSVLPDGTCVAYEKALLQKEFISGLRTVPEKEGASLVALSDTVILVSSAAPETARRLSNWGYSVVSADLSDFMQEEYDGYQQALKGMSLRITR